MKPWELQQIKERITKEGRTEFSHATVMKLIREIERLKKYENAISDIEDAVRHVLNSED